MWVEKFRMRQRGFRDNGETGDPHNFPLLSCVTLKKKFLFRFNSTPRTIEKFRLCQRGFRDNGEAGDPHRFPFPTEVEVAHFVSSKLA